MKDKKIAIIGCGNLGLSILNGLLAENIPASNTVVTRRNVDSLNHLKDVGVNVSTDNKKAINDSEIIIVALKPYTILEVLGDLREQFDPQRHILISLATGISLNQIQEVIQSSTPIFRAMPNTGADVGMSMTCICGNSENSTTIDVVKQCFNSIGETIIIDESLMILPQYSELAESLMYFVLFVQ